MSNITIDDISNLSQASVKYRVVSTTMTSLAKGVIVGLKNYKFPERQEVKHLEGVRNNSKWYLDKDLDEYFDKPEVIKYLARTKSGACSVMTFSGAIKLFLQRKAYRPDGKSLTHRGTYKYVGAYS